MALMQKIIFILHKWANLSKWKLKLDCVEKKQKSAEIARNFCYFCWKNTAYLYILDFKYNHKHDILFSPYIFT